MNDEDDGPQPDTVTTTRRGALLYALWHRPLSAWFAAVILLAQTAATMVLQTASLLLATTLVIWQTFPWRDSRKCGA